MHRVWLPRWLPIRSSSSGVHECLLLVIRRCACLVQLFGDAAPPTSPGAVSTSMQPQPQLMCNAMTWSGTKVTSMCRDGQQLDASSVPGAAADLAAQASSDGEEDEDEQGQSSEDAAPGPVTGKPSLEQISKA